RPPFGRLSVAAHANVTAPSISPRSQSVSTASFDREKPEVDFPGGEPPTELVIEDLIVGEGRTAKSGSTVSAHYVGVAFSTGEEFDASWNRGGPLDFRLGVGQVI